MAANSKKISVEDHIAISNLMGKYQWLVDGGDSDGWADLFTPDGALIGANPEPSRGREELKMVPKFVVDNFGDKMRHMTGSFYIEYGATTDEAYARFYNLVTTWVKSEGPKLFTMALSTAHVVRINGEWKIKSNNVKNLVL
jgi:hypothetical protein